jgi:hypothetical protein
MIEQYTSPAVVNNSQEPWLVGEGVSLSGSIAIPSLDFNFVTDAFPGTVTFTRASSATFFDSAGVLQSAAIDVPRLDYNPATLAARGLLIEEARTNLLLRSEDFATTWSALNVTVATNNANSPAGTLTADTITPAASTAAHLISQSVTVTASTAYSASVFVKSDGAPFVQIAYDNGASVGAFMNVNLSTGAITRGPELAGGATSATGSVTNIGNGFYRIVVGATHTGTTGRVLISPLPAGESLAGLNPSTTTAATDKIILWGAQIEAGAFPTSYIPTTTTALTRAADVASVNTLSPWYNSASGTLYVQGILVGGTAANFPYQSALVGSNVNNDSIGVNWTAASGQVRFTVRSGGVAQADVTAGSNKSAGSSYKIAGRYAANDFQAAIDGSLGTPDTSGSVPTITALSLGGPVSFQIGASVWLQRVTYYPRGLANAELQGITT